jgi:GR25 family glycosyltransferase involved in LPS biosynthesis
VLPIYVIHATHLTERRAHLEDQLGRLGLAATWITTNDASGIDPAMVARYSAPAEGMTPKHLSCALKHLDAHERIASSQTSLVIEDDLVFLRDFVSRLEHVLIEFAALPPRSVAYVGRGGSGIVPRAQRRPAKLLYEAGSSRTTDAYLLTPDAAQARLAWFVSNRLTMPIDLAVNLADKATGVGIYWSHPSLAEQGSLSGRFPSTLNKPRAAWLTTLIYRYKRVTRELRS